MADKVAVELVAAIVIGLLVVLLGLDAIGVRSKWTAPKPAATAPAEKGWEPKVKKER